MAEMDREPTETEGMTVTRTREPGLEGEIQHVVRHGLHLAQEHLDAAVAQWTRKRSGQRLFRQGSHLRPRPDRLHPLGLEQRRVEPVHHQVARVVAFEIERDTHLRRARSRLDDLGQQRLGGQRVEPLRRRGPDLEPEIARVIERAEAFRHEISVRDARGVTASGARAGSRRRARRRSRDRARRCPRALPPA